MAKGTTGKSFEIVKSEGDWRAQLTPEQFRVLREHGTERAGTSALDKEYGPGAYRCAVGVSGRGSSVCPEYR